MIYLSGCLAPKHLDEQVRRGIGMMLSPLAPYAFAGGWLERMPYVAIDNGCFSSVKSFNLDTWLGWVATVPVTPAGILFITVPDVVGDAAATRARWQALSPTVRATGYPLAFVVQDGQDEPSVPWNECDAVFIGGSTAWKIGASAAALARDAKRRGKWVHMGRVNGGRRMKYAARIGCDSADGTHLGFQPHGAVRRMGRWLDGANAPQLSLGLELEP